MFELPEFVTFAQQLNQDVRGKIVQKGRLGNSPHKFVWYNQSPEAFERLTRGKMVGEATAKGKWLFIPLEPGYMLLFGECGGKLLFHPPGSKVPKKYHLYVAFKDGSFLTATTQMWGAYELYEAGAELNRPYILGMRPTPIDPGFTFDHFCGLIDDSSEKKRSAKGLLTQEQLIPGLGNAIAQDILFQACLHPSHAIEDLSADQKRGLYDAIISTVNEAIEKGGRCDEYDLHGKPGGYMRIMDKNAAGMPCPGCGTKIEKIQYLGGACYFCPDCQG
jgi:formamidopyrimidine-DNA glycosylase